MVSPLVRTVGWCPDHKRACKLRDFHAEPVPFKQDMLGEESLTYRVVPVPTGGYEVRGYSAEALRLEGERLMSFVEDMSA